MKLFEYEAKKIFRDKGIPVPAGQLTANYEDGLRFFFSNKPVVLKAQVLTGGRGKAGGIRFSNTEAEFKKEYQNIINLKIGNRPSKNILIEKKLDIKNEFYLGYSILRSEASIIMMISRQGGVEIEELARERPDSIIKYRIDILDGINEKKLKSIMNELGFKGELNGRVTKIALLLYQIFTGYKCEVAEINPLAVTTNGDVIAADARIAIYDEAVSGYPEFIKEEDIYTEIEKTARKQNLGYVEMDGNIGVIGNGAGLNMATLDILNYFGGKPANFLEVSGRTYHKAKEAMEVIVLNPKIRIIFGNFFGCISRCDVIADGIAEAVKEGAVKVPLVIAMRGTGAQEGIRILKNAGLNELYEDDIIAGERVVKLLG